MSSPPHASEMAQKRSGTTNKQSPQKVASTSQDAPTFHPYLFDGNPVDVGELFRSLPTKEDIKAMISNLEDAHCREVQEIRSEITTINTRVDGADSFAAATEARLERLERIQAKQEETIKDLTLHIEDLEDRGRRNNLRIKGLPEPEGREDLPAIVREIFHQLFDAPAETAIKIDRVHRALGPRSGDPNRPRDVLCRLHHYSTKEDLSRLAWRKGSLSYKGAKLQFFSDVSRGTLQRRAILRPLLDRLLEEGFTYKWGHPFHLVVKSEGASFEVHSPADLPDLFIFVDMPPMEVPDWTAQLRDTPGRSRRNRRRRGAEWDPLPARRRPARRRQQRENAQAEAQQALENRQQAAAGNELPAAPAEAP